MIHGADGLCGSSVAHRRFQWVRAGVFLAMGRGHDQSPSGGGDTGPNPTDRGKGSVKRNLLTDRAGVPLGLAVEGANRNEFKMARQILESIPVERPEPTGDAPQGLCLDKGYDYVEVRGLLAEFGFTDHIRARGEEAQAIKEEAGFKARRRVVERTFAWLSRCRAILVRYDKRAERYRGRPPYTHSAA